MNHKNAQNTKNYNKKSIQKYKRKLIIELYNKINTTIKQRIAY